MKIAYSLTCEALLNCFDLFTLSLKSIPFDRQTDNKTTEFRFSSINKTTGLGFKGREREGF